MLIQDQVNVFRWLLYIKIWCALVGTLSDFGTLFRHDTTNRWPTRVLCKHPTTCRFVLSLVPLSCVASNKHVVLLHVEVP
jgi:hypothetical protein